ncbi:unnamed protein product [Sympodiomycopsis kandeliae]
MTSAPSTSPLPTSEGTASASHLAPSSVPATPSGQGVKQPSVVTPTIASNSPPATVKPKLQQPHVAETSSHTSNTGSKQDGMLSEATTTEKKREMRERRVLPARLRRVSSLLAGSDIDEQLLGAAESGPSQRIIPESTVFILTSNPEHHADAYESILEGEGVDALDFFADPEVIHACREKALIETPEFKLRDDSTQMGKTRGGALRSEEDTSDAAYERRHRRPDNAEKRSRRLEKERLVRERQKLRERIEQLKTADPRMLMPIFAARERTQATAGTSSLRGAEAALGLGKHNMSAEAAANLERIEILRSELIEEATETLSRYDALLTEVPQPFAHPSQSDKRTPKEDTSQQTSRSRLSARASDSNMTRRRTAQPVSYAENHGDDEPSRSTPVVRIKRPRASEPVPSSSSSPVKAGSPTSGEVKADISRPNIHARTAGGRFAKKSAIGTVVQEAPRGKRTSDLSPEETGNARLPQPSVPVHKPRPPRPSEIARKAAREAEKAAKAAAAAAAAHGKRPPAVQTQRAESTVRSASSRAWSPPSAAAAEYEHRRKSNRTGSSLAELDASERRPKRVKLIIGNNRNGQESPGAQAREISRSPSSPESLTTSKSLAKGAEQSSPPRSSTDPTRVKFSAPGELSLEQAQQMMEAAMRAAKGGGGPSLSLFNMMGGAPESSATEAKSTTESTIETASAETASTSADLPEAGAVSADQDVEMQDANGQTAAPASTAVKSETKEGEQDFQIASQAAHDESKTSGAGVGAVSNHQENALAGEMPLTSPIKLESADAGVASSSASVPQEAARSLSPVKNAYEPHSASPTYAYLPGRSAAARQRAAANIPLRRASGRVAEMAKGAFGEKLPARATVREDFDNTMMQARYEWSTVWDENDTALDANAQDEAVGEDHQEYDDDETDSNASSSVALDVNMSHDLGEAADVTANAGEASEYDIAAHQDIV